MPDLTAPTFHDGEIDLFLRRRVCARCYSELEKQESLNFSPSNHEYIAVCPTCLDAWNYATVSRSYAEHLGQVYLSDALDVRENLRDLFPSPHAGKSEEQLLSELGF